MYILKRIVSFMLIVAITTASFSNCAYAKGLSIDSLKERSESIKNDAMEKADSIKNDAKEKADIIKNDAKDKADSITNDAQQKMDSAKKSATELADNAKNGVTDAYNTSTEYINSIVTSIDTKKFEKGWDIASKYVSANLSAQMGATYVQSVQTAITNAQTNLYNVSKTNQTLASKAGFVAEEWHTGTFNVDSVAAGSNYKAERPASNSKASSDINITKDGQVVKKIGSKYYKDGTSSAKAQSKTIMQNYSEYVAKTQKDGKTPLSFNDYLDANVELQEAYKILDSEYASEYAGQTRLIPADQMDAASEYLRKKINKESVKEGANRKELAKGYQDTLDNLADRITAEDGTQSRPLSEEEAKAIADLCDNGDFDIEEFGITPSQMIKPKYILKQSMIAGGQAAALEVALSVGPELYTVIADGIEQGYIDEKELKEVGVDAAFAGANGFVEGSVSAAIITACQAGKFGASAKNLSPDAIGTLTVLTIDAIKYGYKLSNGEITTEQYGDLLAEEIFVALVSNASGIALQTLLPCVPFAYLAGSMIGGMIASAAYETSKEVVLQVAAGNGFEAIIPTTVSDTVNVGKETVAAVDIKGVGKELKTSTISATSTGLIKIKSIVN